MMQEYLRQDGEITVDKLASVFEVSRRTILRDLEELRLQKRISRVGADINGYWIVL